MEPSLLSSTCIVVDVDVDLVVFEMVVVNSPVSRPPDSSDSRMLSSLTVFIYFYRFCFCFC